MGRKDDTATFPNFRDTWSLAPALPLASSVALGKTVTLIFGWLTRFFIRTLIAQCVEFHCDISIHTIYFNHVHLLYYSFLIPPPPG
jgi:hypothetical protein